VLYLNKVKSHRHDRHAEDDVGSSSNHLEVGGCWSETFAARHQVAETDRWDGNKAVIGGPEPVPALPDAEQQRPHEDVAGDQAHGHSEWNAYFVVFVVVIIFIIVIDCNKQETREELRRAQSERTEQSWSLFYLFSFASYIRITRFFL